VSLQGELMFFGEENAKEVVGEFMSVWYLCGI